MYGDKKANSTLAAAAYLPIFTLLFLFVFLRNDYYRPSTLHLKADIRSADRLNIQWDSGRGFNSSEMLEYSVSAKPQQGPVFLPLSSKKSGDWHTVEINLPLPQLKLKALRISGDRREGLIRNLELSISLPETGETVLHKIFAGPEREHLYREAIHEKTRKSSAVLIMLQALLALLLTWISSEAWNALRNEWTGSFGGTVKRIFYEDRRWTFWAFTAISASSFLFWLAGNWPAAMDTDSLFCWLSVKTLVFSNHHPYLQQVMFVLFSQIWDSVALVAVTQVILTACIGSYGFYYLVKKGLAWYIVVPFFVIFAVSIQVCTNTIHLRKDTIFSILTLFWSLYIFHLYFNRGAERFGVKKIIILSSLFVLLVMTRNNGIVYLVSIPAVFLVLRLMPRRAFAMFMGATLLLLIVLKIVIPRATDIEKNTNHVMGPMCMMINPVAALFVNKTYYSDDYAGDIMTIERIIPIEEIRKKYTPETSSPLVFSPKNRATWSDDTSLLRGLYRLYFVRMAQNIPIFIGDRSQLFLKLMTFPRDNFKELSKYRPLRNGHPLYKNPDKSSLWYIEYSPLNHDIMRMCSRLYRFTRTGINNFLFFNTLISTLCLMLVLIGYKRYPASAAVSFLYLSHIAFLFFILPAASSRYLYFVSLYSNFFIPFLLLEHRMRKMKP